MRNHWRRLRQKQVIRFRIDRIQAARANFRRIVIVPGINLIIFREEADCG